MIRAGMRTQLYSGGQIDGVGIVGQRKVCDCMGFDYLNPMRRNKS
jgi:hypothetical protein